MQAPETMPSLPFSRAVSEKLSDYGSIRTFQEGETILSENAYIRSIPIVKSGSIRVMRTDKEGKEILLYYIKPGESCIMSFLGGMHQDTSKIKVIAEEEVEILFIPVERVNLLIKESPEWLDYIFRLYHKRFEELLDVVNSIAFKHMDDRILLFLLDKKKLSGSPDIQITHQQMADELGSSRVVVSRLLKQLESEGHVRLFRNKITLL